MIMDYTSSTRLVVAKAYTYAAHQQYSFYTAIYLLILVFELYFFFFWKTQAYTTTAVNEIQIDLRKGKKI